MSLYILFHLTYILVKLYIYSFYYFRECFEEHREKLPQFFKDNEEPVLWLFHRRMIFQRIILFLDRLKLIHGLFATALEIFKIEKVVVAGLKGRDLTNKIDHILQVI